MGIAGEVIQEFELSKDSEVGVGAESSFEFGQSSDFVPQEMFAESLWVEREWTHNVKFRLIESSNRNYNTMDRRAGKRPAVASFPIFTVVAGSTGIRRWRLPEHLVMIAFRLREIS